MIRIYKIILLMFGWVSSMQVVSQELSNSTNRLSAISKIKEAMPHQDHYSPGQSMAGYCDLSKSHTIDTARFEISYTADILLDTLNTKKTKDIVVVQIGDSIYKYYGWVCWQHNMNYTLFEANNEDKQIKVDPIYQPAVDYAVFRDIKYPQILNRHLLPRLNNIIYEFRETRPQFNWKITTDTLTIAGYLCNKATGKYAGRMWTVWFTPQIPIDSGLWKFNGLPGLILEALDDKNYFYFTLRKIEKVSDPIIYYEIPKKIVSREEFRTIEQKIYRHPLSGNIMDFIAVPNPQTGKMEFLPDDWQIPYNPIERE